MLPEGDTLLCSLLNNYILLIFYAVPDEVGQEEIREQVKNFEDTSGNGAVRRYLLDRLHSA